MNDALKKSFFCALGSFRCSIGTDASRALHEPPGYGTVCPVVWEDGGGDLGDCPILGRIDREPYFGAEESPANAVARLQTALGWSGVGCVVTTMPPDGSEVSASAARRAFRVSRQPAVDRRH
jgi:hypothetical protein